MKEYLSIGETARILGVTVTTLRRWDKNGKLKSTRMPSGHRRYSNEQIEAILQKSIFSTAMRWAANKTASEPSKEFFCQNSAVFQIRLMQMGKDLSQIHRLNAIYPLIVAATGEIGNNSFDHNLGNWPDIGGIFFEYDLEKREIALADRGQGILQTLQKVKPQLKTHERALKIAFTEIISGRSPEERGNGLKFVRKTVAAAGFSLFFQTGNAILRLSKNTPSVKIKTSKNFLNGCFALIKF